MNISIGDAINKAWEQMTNVCFKPFDAGKWFGLGFCAWLATLLEGGGGNFNIPSDLFSDDFGGDHGTGYGYGGGPAEDFAEATEFMREYAVVVVAVIVFVVILMVVFSWLAGRGQFMLIDGIVRNRGDVAAPWSEYKAEGNSLFIVRTLFMFLFFGALAGIGVLGFTAVWPQIESGGEPGRELFAKLALPIAIFAIVMILYIIVEAFLMNFLVPTMYAARCGVGEAWSLCRNEMFSGNFGSIILYLLVKIGLNIGVALVTTLVILCTCCIAALPYLGTVILLPVHVFLKAYSLYFVDQFGPKFAIFSASADDDGGDPGAGGSDDSILPPKPYMP